MANLKLWFLETRPQFLILSVVLAFLGTTIAWYGNSFNIWYAVLAGFGLILTHASVNIFNDYFDYRSGIDLKTRRTPFSGGSGLIPAGKLSQRQVFILGTIIFIMAVPIGIYFITVSGILLLPLLLVAAFLIILYSPFILKRPWPEWSAGVGLGALPVLGFYFIQTGTYTSDAVIAAIPSALLVHNLLLLNEFPDIEADATARRQTVPIKLGRRKAAIIFTVTALGVYVWILAFSIIGIMPIWTLLALLCLPLTLKAINGAFSSEQTARLMPAMAANVASVQLIQILIAVGYIISKAIQT